MGKLATAHILDLGCGTGDYPIRANLSAADDVVGVDIDDQKLVSLDDVFRTEAFIALAANRCHFPLLVSTGSFPQLPFPTWTFREHWRKCVAF